MQTIGLSDFYQFAPGIKQDIVFTASFSHDYRLCTFQLHAHWTPTDNNAGVIKWGLEYSFSKSTNKITKEAKHTIDGKSHKHLVTDLGEIEISFTDSPIMLCRLYRDGASEEDTYPSHVVLFNFLFNTK